MSGNRIFWFNYLQNSLLRGPPAVEHTHTGSWQTQNITSGQSREFYLASCPDIAGFFAHCTESRNPLVFNTQIQIFNQNPFAESRYLCRFLVQCPDICILGLMVQNPDIYLESWHKISNILHERFATRHAMPILSEEICGWFMHHPTVCHPSTARFSRGNL